MDDLASSVVYVDVSKTTVEVTETEAIIEVINEKTEVIISGDQGPQGIQGPTGPTGPTGPAGAAAGITYKAGVPASKTSTGTIGQLSIDGANGVLYICTEENTWQKVSLNSANFTNPGGFV